MSAIFSPCGTYRYVLQRNIPQIMRWVKPCLFIMMNPSRAGAVNNDPTATRTINFATSWGCTELTLINLHAFVTERPTTLIARHKRGEDTIGPENDRHTEEQIERHSKIGVIIVAWGANPFLIPRAKQIQHLLTDAKALRVTKKGWPEHPLYIPSNTEPKPWKFP